MEQTQAVSRVSFIPVSDGDSPESIRHTFTKLLKHSPFLSDSEHTTHAVVKLHFGEEGNTGYVKPLWVRVLCDNVRERGGTVVVSDTNTLYRGRRLDSADHLALAHEHGFTQ